MIVRVGSGWVTGKYVAKENLVSDGGRRRSRDGEDGSRKKENRRARGCYLVYLYAQKVRPRSSVISGLVIT